MAITNGYCTLPELKASLKISDSIDDSLLEIAVEAASRWVDTHTNRYFYNAGTAVKVFAAEDGLVVYPEDYISLSKVESLANLNQTDWVEWATTDYQLEPLNGRSEGVQTSYTAVRAVGQYVWPTWYGQALVRLTGVWGWSAVPVAVKQATIIQAARTFKRNDSPTGVMGFGDIGVMRVGTQVDPDVKALLAPYVRINGFA